MESRQRPRLFENLIRDPPPQGLQAPISNEEFEKINRYVERARNLKGAYCQDIPKPLQANRVSEIWKLPRVLQNTHGCGPLVVLPNSCHVTYLVCADALIEFDEALLEQWEDFLKFHRGGHPPE